MTNIQAAFLYDQLNNIQQILSNKHKIFNNYEKLLSNLINNGKVKLFQRENDTINSHWIFSVRIINNIKSIEETTNFFKKYNVDIRPFFYPINKHGHLKTIKNEDETSYVLNNEIIMIPSSPTISLEEQEQVVDAINTFLQKN
jgi:dTDP-4-amino-4,6-dideoxygalactose transaminase